MDVYLSNKLFCIKCKKKLKSGRKYCSDCQTSYTRRAIKKYSMK